MSDCDDRRHCMLRRKTDKILVLDKRLLFALEDGFANRRVQWYHDEFFVSQIQATSHRFCRAGNPTMRSR